MKKVLRTLLIATLAIVTVVSFSACKVDPIVLPEQSIGLTMTAAPEGATAINSDMTAVEMLAAAEANYYLTDYFAQINYNGGVVTRILGNDIKQGVDAVKIRDGKIGVDGTEIYIMNRSWSSMAKMKEEALYTYGGNVVSRTANKTKATTDRLIIKSYNSTKTQTYEEYVNETNNDIATIWAYDLKASTIASTTDPVYDKTTKTYSFDVVANVSGENSAITNYLKVMEFQMNSNVGLATTIDFEKLELHCVIYENGMFRAFSVSEAYTMTINAFSFKTSITNNILNQFTYDKAEMLKFDFGQEEESVAIKTLPYTDIIATVAEWA